jgi:UDPglucose 6-dehydrogenase
MHAGIIGNGFVGKATAQLESSDCPFMIYDTDPTKCRPSGLTLRELRDTCDVIFICVPTPMDVSTGSCCTKIVEGVIHALDNHPGIIIRSTVPIGFNKKHKTAFMPEFLTESNAQLDFVQTPEWFIGVNDPSDPIVSSLSFILKKACNEKKIDSCAMTSLSSEEAETMKYFRNCFLATKVSFCNEIYQFCRSRNIDYDTVVYHAAKDDRIGNSHVRVPGPDGKRGFGGTCFPKDVSSLIYQIKTTSNAPCPILSAIFQRNNEYDRPEKDWMSDKGRAVID